MAEIEVKDRIDIPLGHARLHFRKESEDGAVLAVISQSSEYRVPGEDAERGKEPYLKEICTFQMSSSKVAKSFAEMFFQVYQYLKNQEDQKAFDDILDNI